MSTVDTKNPLSFNTHLTDLFSSMSISHKYNLVGSSNIMKNIYTTDYDLNEIFDSSNDVAKTYSKIQEFFRELFISGKENNSVYIVDFKCGEYKNEPLRWSCADICAGRIGTGRSGQRYISFIEALKMKSRIKLDMVYHLNGSFVEVSMIYYIKVGEHRNYTDDEMGKPHIVSELKKDIVLYTNEGNLMKVLKRKYSLFKTEDTHTRLQADLLDYFNTKVGLVYKSVADLKLILELREQTFRKVSPGDFYEFQQIIKQQLNILDLPRVFKYLDCRALSVAKINMCVKILQTIINKDCVKHFGFILNGR